MLETIISVCSHDPAVQRWVCGGFKREGGLARRIRRQCAGICLMALRLSGLRVLTIVSRESRLLLLLRGRFSALIQSLISLFARPHRQHGLKRDADNFRRQFYTDRWCPVR